MSPKNPSIVYFVLLECFPICGCFLINVIVELIMEWEQVDGYIGIVP